MHIDFEYSAEKHNDSRDWSRGPAERSRRRVPFDENPKTSLNKENLTPNRNFEANIGTSKSYIMAMRSLQSKLEEKEKRIRELEHQLRDHQSENEPFPNHRSRQTANFGLADKRNEYQRPKIEMVSVEKSPHHQSVETEGATSRHGKSANCRCGEYDSLSCKYEESQRETELLRKKFQNQKDQCSQLQTSLDENNKHVASLEALLQKKDKELRTLSAALKNMQDLVDIISKKKKDTLSLQNCDTNDSSGTNSMVCLTKYSEEYSPNNSKKHAQAGHASFESILKDMVSHILLNPELSFEHLDLYSAMRERLVESKESFGRLEGNYDFLKKTKSILIEESKVGPADPDEPESGGFAEDVRGHAADRRTGQPDQKPAQPQEAVIKQLSTTSFLFRISFYMRF